KIYKLFIKDLAFYDRARKNRNGTPGIMTGYRQISYGQLAFLPDTPGCNRHDASDFHEYSYKVSDRRRAVALGWIIIALTLVLPIGYTHAVVTFPKDLQPPLASGVRNELIALFFVIPLFFFLQILLYLRLGSVKPSPK